MKKLFKYYLLAMAVVLTVSLASCSSDEDILDTEEEELFDDEIYDVVVKLGFNDNAEKQDCSFLHAYASVREEGQYSKLDASLEVNEDPFDFYYLMIEFPGDITNLKAGEEIKDYSIGMHLVKSSEWYAPGDPDTEYTINGTLRVEKVTKKYVVLKFENLTVEELRRVHPNYMAYSVSGRIKYEISE